MAFGFGDIGSMFSKGMAQYGQGLDKMHALPLGQKLMEAGQIAHGGVSPFDMLGAVDKLGQPQQPGAPAPATMPPPMASPPAPQAGQGGNPQDMILQGLLPLLMKNGMGSGLLGGSGGSGGPGMNLGGLLGGFGFGRR